MKKVLVVLVVLAGIAAAATWFRFESYDPCVWLEVEYANDKDISRELAATKIRLDFLILGVFEPGASDCLEAWWRFRIKGAKDAQ